MADIFLSYCSSDREIARKIAGALAAEGISVWWDDRLTPIEHWDRLIETEIHAASTVMVIWTPRAVERDWVRIEANFGRDKKKLLQIRLEDCEVPLQFTLLQWVNLDAWLANGESENWRRLIVWFRALVEARMPVAHVAQAKPEVSVPTGATSTDTDNFGMELADIARAAAYSGSGSYDDVAIPALGDKWPAFVADCRIVFRAVEQALALTPPARVMLFEAGLHLSLYFMRIRDEYQSFSSLRMAMTAMSSAGASELEHFLPSLRSVARIAIEKLGPEDIAHYALGRMLGATAHHVCKAAPEQVKREWLAITSITLSAYGGQAEYLTSGFREMSGDAGYSTEIVRFEIPEVGSAFASALLGHTASARFISCALERFSALTNGTSLGPAQ